MSNELLNKFNKTEVEAKKSRVAIYEAIDSERSYQIRKWAYISLPKRNVVEVGHEVGAWLLLIRQHVDAACADWCGKPTDAQAIEGVRKIAALAVAFMEQHGAPMRDLSIVTNARDKSLILNNGLIASK